MGLDSNYATNRSQQHDLKTRLVSQDCLRRIISLCDSGRVAKHEEGTSSVAFHSAQALSMLMKSDSDLALTLIKMDAISDIIEALHDKSGPVLVSVLRIMDGLAKHADARPVMKTAFIIPTLLKLAKQFDDFVAPAAVRVLCSLQEPITGDQEKNDADRSTADLRETMLQSGVLSTFLDMLNHCSADTKQVASDALVEFAKHDENRRALIDDGHLHTLATRAQSHITHKRDGAIMTLVALSEKGQVRAAVKAAITKARTIETLVARLKQKSNALSAASALAGLVKIDDVATMVIAEGLNVPAHINNMLRRRWFDGSHGEDGINVLWHLFECECASQRRQVGFPSTTRSPYSASKGATNCNRNSPRTLRRRFADESNSQRCFYIQHHAAALGPIQVRA
ncbi:ARM repeat-containing protein [Paxillus ammoniavirescens]|nr:ARM repeat-containing protein [Paxillus ammoniavirescens]